MTQPPPPPPPEPAYGPYGPYGPYGNDPGVPPSGYGLPPAPGYPGQAQLSQQDERMWAMLSHLGGLLIGFIAPLIVLLVQAPKSAFVRRQSVEALNFQITLAIATVVCAVLFIVLIGFFLLPIVIVGGVVLMIIAGVKTNGGEDYRYPINIRFVK